MSESKAEKEAFRHTHFVVIGVFFWHNFFSSRKES